MSIAIRSRALADEVLLALEAYSDGGLNKEKLAEDWSSGLLPRIYDTLNLFALATSAPAAVEVSKLAKEVTRLVFNLGDIAWHAGKHGENVGTPYHATHEIFAAKLKALATMASPEVMLNGLTEAETTASASVQGLSEAGRLAGGGEAVRLSLKGCEQANLSPKAIDFLQRGADAMSLEFRQSRAEKAAAIASAPLATTQASPTSAVERETGGRERRWAK